SQKSPRAWLEPAVAQHDPLIAYATTADLAQLTRRLYADERPGRAQRLARQLDPARRQVVLGWLAQSQQLPERARAHLADALAARQGKSRVAWFSLHALSEGGQRAAPGVAQRGLVLARQLGAPPSPVILAKLEATARRLAAAPPPRAEAAAD